MPTTDKDKQTPKTITAGRRFCSLVLAVKKYEVKREHQNDNHVNKRTQFFFTSKRISSQLSSVPAGVLNTKKTMTASKKIVLTFSVSVEGLSECFNIIIPEKKESGQKKKRNEHFKMERSTN